MTEAWLTQCITKIVFFTLYIMIIILMIIIILGQLSNIGSVVEVYLEYQSSIFDSECERCVGHAQYMQIHTYIFETTSKNMHN